MFFQLFSCQAYFGSAPLPPWLLRAGLLLSHSLLIISLFFLKVTFPCVPCEKQSYIAKGRAGEIGCRVGASIADARFPSGTVALAPHSSSWPPTPLLALCPGHPLLCSCPQRSHSDAFLSMCLAHITAYLKKVLHYLLKNLSFQTHSKCYVLNGTFWALSSE